MNDIAVQVSGLAKCYGDFWALKGISFSVRKGEIFGFLGPNGAGKTTTLRIITGLSKPTRGEAFVLNHSVTKDEIWVKQHIGVVPEISNLYPELNAIDNLIFIAQLYGLAKKDWKVRAEELLKEFGLYERSNVLFSKFSKGMKRKLTIAAALMHKPEILFLDEPTAGLDVLSSRNLRFLIKKLNRLGVTVFLTTHNIKEADELCNRIAIIVKGEIIAIDSPQNLKEKAPIRNLLLLRVDKVTLNLKKKLSKLAGIKGIVQENNLFRIHTDEINLTLDSILKLLHKEKIKINSINTASPSLEDAFVYLTGLDLEIMKIDKEIKR